MAKTLTRHGNSLALVIDKPILELLKIDEHTRPASGKPYDSRADLGIPGILDPGILTLIPVAVSGIA